jgi:UDP-N-acetylmuramyl pentapeptide phosphotransferase/UDP-N-acetylglucosamine-1-phosphate transferase
MLPNPMQKFHEWLHMNGGNIASWSLEVGVLFIFPAIISAGLLMLLTSFLRHYALAHPNERSSHKIPTPQSGGIAVVAAMLIVVIVAVYLSPHFAVHSANLIWVLAAAIALAVLGAIDDIRPLEALPRLSLQAVAVVVVIAALPINLRVLPMLPWWIERLVLLIGGLWFVNLVNFMDGLDWMTVAEVVPITSGLAIFGLAGALPQDATLVALALCGAMVGFAPFNRPVARIFLGDVGSLPIGLLLCWLLVSLAGAGHLAAAVLLPLYYVADTTITLLRRLIDGEPIMQAHRSHFYQRAADGGLGAYKIVGYALQTNIILFGLASLTLLNASKALHAAILAAGIGVVGALLWRFSCAGRRKTPHSSDSKLNV